MTDEDKKKERLEKARAAKRAWWHSEKGKAWRDARKAKGLEKDEPKGPTST